ncbi:MAG: sigma-70 family RNA polymerase sigma factor [Verrucomicrobiae bacterium]|nr:sigma-70 family RNA polymerase sigma factor [Verrucomicrobiae bacterium]NNJ42608.1 sigma-70 family RNA polymerase sigma factor [Akkermansiaceae bacterium]
MKLRSKSRLRVKASEKSRIEDIFEAEETPLLRYAYGMVMRREVAEEIVQDAFLKLHKHWKDIDQPRAWLYRATRNLSLNYLRKYQRESLTEDSDMEPTAHDLPDVELGRMEAIGTLRILIEELPTADRELIRLKYDDELSYGRIGEALELSTGNVGYKLHHLLKHLSEALQKAGISSPRG